MKRWHTFLLCTAWAMNAGIALSGELPATCPPVTTRTAIDMDADGRPDRTYAADAQARIWRIDADGDPPRLFADLGNAAGTRRFLAAPDVSLATGADGQPWLRIAIGSAGPGSNRFYVLHDPLQPAQAPVIHEHHLHRWPQAADEPARAIPAGHYLDLGDAQVLSPSLTTAGRITFTAAIHAPDAACRADIGIGTFDARTGRGIGEDTGMHEPGWRQAVLPDHPAMQSIAIRYDARTRLIECLTGTEPIPACATPVPVRRRYWRREDAD